ncbi:hypothetical protein R3P38DRAFT_682964 [Favolaschia claudopus]|uniref:Uncharacterized protein n=1 Tax=Favolaschia claudopus TaxID=2862362 RepID=A0AAW0EDM5_9AGAR
MAVTVSAAAFFEVLIGSFLYGLFLLLAILSTMLYIQRISREGTRSHRTLTRTIIRKPMIMGGLLISLVVSVRWILDVIDAAHGFLYLGDPDFYFLAPVGLRRATGVGFLLASVVVGDTMIIYRLWIVWNKSTAVVVFPILTLSGLLGAGIGVAHRLTVTPPGESLFSEKLKRCIVQESVFSLVTNVYATGKTLSDLTSTPYRSYHSALIAYRICTTTCGVSDAAMIRVKTGNDLTRFLATLVESSALLSVWIVFEMITYWIKSPLHWFVLGNMGTISGISFMLINVRVALGSSRSDQPIMAATKIELNVNEFLAVSAGVRTDTQVDPADDCTNGTDQ